MRLDPSQNQPLPAWSRAGSCERAIADRRWSTLDPTCREPDGVQFSPAYWRYLDRANRDELVDKFSGKSAEAPPPKATRPTVDPPRREAAPPRKTEETTLKAVAIYTTRHPVMAGRLLDLIA